jgi:RimJ/RimL family protein N-acetyltransferase
LNKPFLIGKKVYLRGLEESDLENIQRWLCDSGVTKLLFQGDIPPNLHLMKEEFHKKMSQNNEIVFAIVSKANNLHVGWAGIYEINWVSRNGELRFFIGEKKHWRKGLTTESVSLLIDYAFNKLNLHRVYGGANIENHGSVKIFRKLGFSQEGISKEGHYRNGRYYDLIRFGLLNKKQRS